MKERKREKNGRKKWRKGKKEKKKGGGRNEKKQTKSKKRMYMFASPVSTRCGSCKVAVELSLILPIVCRVDRPDITVMVDWTLTPIIHLCCAGVLWRWYFPLQTTLRFC